MRSQGLHWLAVLVCAACNRKAAPEPTRDPVPAVDASAPGATEAPAAMATATPRLPVELPPVPEAWEAMKGTRGVGPYFLERSPCRPPIVRLSGWINERDDWSIVAYRCDNDSGDRWPSEPWESDGSYFLWGSHDDVTLEVRAHPSRGPRPQEHLAYVEKALGRLGATRPSEQDPVDAEHYAKLKGLVANLAKRTKGGPCDPRFHMEWDLLPEARGQKLRTAHMALSEAALCIECASRLPEYRRLLCGYAQGMLEDLAGELAGTTP